MSLDANIDAISTCEKALAELKSELDALKIDVDLSSCTSAFATELQTLITEIETTYKSKLGSLLTNSRNYTIQTYYYLLYADQNSSVGS